MKEAWESYEAKPEYKEFNKHDMIEAMQKMKKIKVEIKKRPTDVVRFALGNLSV